LKVESKPESFRFGELNVDRVRRILAATPPRSRRGRRQAAGIMRWLSASHVVFTVLKQPRLHRRRRHRLLHPRRPAAAIRSDGHLRVHGREHRHRPGPAPRPAAESEARRVVSVIGDSTFVHSGITGLVEMVYNPPPPAMSWSSSTTAPPP
jgi:indolepyruvate ferredoxin oxidoreductase, alpha subunit